MPGAGPASTPSFTLTHLVHRVLPPLFGVAVRPAVPTGGSTERFAVPVAVVHEVLTQQAAVPPGPVSGAAAGSHAANRRRPRCMACFLHGEPGRSLTVPVRRSARVLALRGQHRPGGPPVTPVARLSGWHPDRSARLRPRCKSRATGWTSVHALFYWDAALPPQGSGGAILATGVDGTLAAAVAGAALGRRLGSGRWSGRAVSGGAAGGGRAGIFLPDDPVPQRLHRGVADILGAVLAGGEQRGAHRAIPGARG